MSCPFNLIQYSKTSIMNIRALLGSVANFAFRYLTPVIIESIEAG